MRYEDPRFSRNERDREEGPREPGRRGSDYGRDPRDSFYPGNHGFREGEYPGRMAGDPNTQPYSENPEDYDRDQTGLGRGGQDDYGSREFRESREPYGQREPYGASGSGGGTYGASGYGPYRGEGQRPFREGGGRPRWDESRYSESQYGLRRGEERDYGGGYGRAGFGRGYDAERGQWRRSGAGGGFGRGPGYRGGYGGGLGSGPFSDTREEPRFFGTGYYGDGGAGFGGGYDERMRARSRPEPGPGARYGERYGSEQRYGAQQRYGEEQPYGNERQGWGWRAGGGERGGRMGGSMQFNRGPKGYQRSDERLREEICERLIQAGDIDSSDVTVTVSNCRVTLEGTVPDRYMKHEIEDLVDAAPGVQDIDNRIRVERRGMGRSAEQSAGQGTGQNAGQGVGQSAGYASTPAGSASPGTAPAASQQKAGSGTAGPSTTGPSSTTSGRSRKE